MHHPLRSSVLPRGLRLAATSTNATMAASQIRPLSTSGISARPFQAVFSFLHPPPSSNVRRVSTSPARRLDVNPSKPNYELRVSDVLKLKNVSQWTVDERASVFDATKKMVEYGVGGLLVTKDGGKPTGIVTERDYLRKVVHAGRSSPSTLVSEIATPTDRLFVASLDDSVQDAIDIMGSQSFRHLPVEDPKTGEIVGVLSIGDVAKALAKERKIALRKLQDKSQKIPIHDG